MVLRKLAAGIFLILLCVANSASATLSLVERENFKLTLKGYYKNLFFTSNDIANDSRYYGDLNRVRTEWDAKAWDWLSSKVVWDNEVILGNYVGSFDFAATQSLRDTPQMNLYYDIVHKDNFDYGQNFYRAYVKINPNRFSLVAGRQKIDWGVARLLSPTDLYTPLSTFALEPVEKVGTDSANLVIPVAQKTRFNLVYSVNRYFDKSRTGARLTQTVGRFDVSVLGGRFLKDSIVGGDFTGDFHSMGLRGEFMYDFADFGKDFVQLMMGMDYGFANSFTVVAEYFFNGQATDTFSPTFLLTSQPTANQIQTQHSQFLALQMKYDITPLLTPSLLSAWDIVGSSVFVAPDLKYSILSWMDLSVGAHFPVGRAEGEFTQLPNLYYVQTQFFY